MDNKFEEEEYLTLTAQIFLTIAVALDAAHPEQRGARAEHPLVVWCSAPDNKREEQSPTKPKQALPGGRCSPAPPLDTKRKI